MIASYSSSVWVKIKNYLSTSDLNLNKVQMNVLLSLMSYEQESIFLLVLSCNTVSFLINWSFDLHGVFHCDSGIRVLWTSKGSQNWVQITVSLEIYSNNSFRLLQKPHRGYNIDHLSSVWLSDHYKVVKKWFLMFLESPRYIERELKILI